MLFRSVMASVMSEEREILVLEQRIKRKYEQRKAVALTNSSGVKSEMSCHRGLRSWRAYTANREMS